MRFCAKKSGFSLIELMVVISIIALLTSLALPKIISIKIRAARAEIYTIVNTIYTAAEAHKADAGAYPAGSGIAGGYYMPGMGGPVLSSYCNMPNSLNLKIANCEKLRYIYRFFSGGMCARCSLAGDNAGLKMFVIDAIALSYSIGPSYYRTGDGPPTSMCKAPSGYDSYFMDGWEMYETRNLQPYGNNANLSDATINCFR